MDRGLSADLQPSPAIEASLLHDLRHCAFCTPSRLLFLRPAPRRRRSTPAADGRCALLVQTRASAGRFSGAVHGSQSSRRNSRRRNILRHNDDDDDDNDDDYINGEEKHKKGIAREPSVEGSEVCWCRDNDYHLSGDTNRGTRLGTDVYDSIHGAFWSNDPYYQELEDLHEGTLWGNADVGETSSHGEKCRLHCDESSTMPLLDAANSTKTWRLQSKIDSRDDGIFSTRGCSPLQEDAICDLSILTAGDKDTLKENFEVRETENAERPAGILGSLEAVDALDMERRQSPGNAYVRPICSNSVMTQHGTSPDGGVDLSEAAPMQSNAQGIGLQDDKLVLLKTSDQDAGVSYSKQSVQDDASSISVAEQVGLVVEQVAELIPETFKEQVGQVVDHVENIPTQVSQAAEQVVAKVVDQVTDALPDPVVEQVGQVAEHVSNAAEQIVEQVTTKATEIANFLSADEDDEESDDEFEAYTSSDMPEFKGIRGLNNFTIVQENQGIVAVVYDFYIVMLKKSLPEFVLGMFAAPILLSVIFTILYLPEFNGLALDETAREFFRGAGKNAEVDVAPLEISWKTLFEVFMFSVSLSTGLQPELTPLSPYTLVVANLNALIAQLIFVFLSGAVFARLSQPSQPVKCSTVALVCPPPSNRRLRKEARYKSFLTRYVLVGPQPTELVDVKVDLTYKYNTITRSGTYFRQSQSLKLVRPEIAFLNHGMLLRHVIDETSPLYHRTQGMLEKEDAIFSLSVVGLERSSMQSVFHVQHYCVYDGDVIWDAEFEDMILINKKCSRVVDHSLLSKWRQVISN